MYRRKQSTSDWWPHHIYRVRFNFLLAVFVRHYLDQQCTSAECNTSLRLKDSSVPCEPVRHTLCLAAHCQDCNNTMPCKISFVIVLDAYMDHQIFSVMKYMMAFFPMGVHNPPILSVSNSLYVVVWVLVQGESDVK
jgi:hypothetical protein